MPMDRFASRISGRTADKYSATRVSPAWLAMPHCRSLAAREALAELVDWDLAEDRKRSGIYVRDFRPIVRESIGRLGSST